ncbi:DUF2628 domain-containing protein [uncultured Ferrovibrio sp.]|jgi:hypothetical protein|uniref:DUF2628 domain-containing protein n=1 Tax=uncultured Ferrovibrio sp. TaxID=1576913 RepID=UPI00263A0CD8|nr:DUF2628 domain-containing protein [uncultured Ferrovibrio sp.]
MRFFTLHERPGNGGDPDLLAVGSGFSWWAALFPLIWLLWHRLWLGLAIYIVAGLLLGLALDLGGIAEPAATVIGLGISFLIGAMAADYRRWTYDRRGYRMVGVVLARDAMEAEERYMLERYGRSRGSQAQTAPPSTLPPFVPTPPRAPMGGNIGGNAAAFPRLV